MTGNGRPRARRLTLAPSPRRASLSVGDEGFIHVQASLSMAGRQRAKCSADPLAGHRSSPGSKFWPLADELSSDEEEENFQVEGEALSEIGGRSVGAGASSRDASTEQHTSASRVACLGHDQFTRSTVQVATRRCSFSKPWRGPLPPPRTSPRLTMRDVLARARVESMTGNMPVETGYGVSRRSDLVRIHGRRARFNFPSGLSELFARSGKLRSRCSAKASSTLSPRQAEVLDGDPPHPCSVEANQKPSGFVSGKGDPCCSGEESAVAASSTVNILSIWNELVKFRAFYEDKITEMTDKIKELEAKFNDMAASNGIMSSPLEGAHVVVPSFPAVVALEGTEADAYRTSGDSIFPGAVSRHHEDGDQLGAARNVTEGGIATVHSSTVSDVCVSLAGDDLYPADGCSNEMVAELDTQKVHAGGTPVVVIKATTGVKKASSNPVSCPRLAGTEEKVLEHAKKTAWKNLDPKGNTFSFLSFSDHCVSSNIANLGVSLGNNEKQVASSVSLLRQLENQRVRPKPVSLVETYESHSDFFDSEDEDNELETLTLGHLCGDLMEEVLDEDSDHLSCDFQTVFKKNKLKGTSRKKKNAKIRIVKKHRNGAK